jgi:hypothetical protein
MWILMFFFLQKKGHLKKNILRKLRKMFSVDHKNQFYICQSSFLQKIKKIEEETHFFFQLWKFEKKSSMTGHPIWILSQKFEFVFFSFCTLKDLSKMISYLYFGYLNQKLYLKNPNSWAIFDTKQVFFKNRYFYKKNFFWQNELTCSFRKVQNKIYIFLSKIWRPNFYWCSIFSSCHRIHLNRYPH